MRAGVRSSLGARSDPWRGRLVAAQFALSVILLGGAGLLIRSYATLLQGDGLIDATRYSTMRVVLPDAAYATGERRNLVYRDLTERIAAVPGVEAVTFASVVPFLPTQRQTVTLRAPVPGGDTTLTSGTVAIGDDYFETLGLTLLSGRAFGLAAGPPSDQVAIVNELFVDRFLAGGDPIGRQIRVTQLTPDPHPGATAATDQSVNAPWLTVVGVAPTIRQSVASGPRPLVYLPHTSAPDSTAQLIVRTPSSGSAIATIRAQVAAVDDDVLLTNIRPLEDALRNSRLQPHLIATVLGSLGLVALFLSAVGLYAITSHGVRQRTAEIGLRLALGAQPAQVVWLFMRRGLTPIVAGLLIGLVGAFGVGQILRGALIDTSVTDPATLATLLLVLTMVTACACLIPARGAARVDPATTLRQN